MKRELQRDHEGLPVVVKVSPLRGVLGVSRNGSSIGQVSSNEALIPGLCDPKRPRPSHQELGSQAKREGGMHERIHPEYKGSIPQPRVGHQPQKFRIYSGLAMTVVDPASVAVEWRNPIFGRATRARVLPTGEVVRREILMESPAEDYVDEIPEWPSLASVPALGSKLRELSPRVASRQA